MLVSGGVRRFKCCVISAPEGAFGRFQACVIYIGLAMTLVSDERHLNAQPYDFMILRYNSVSNSNKTHLLLQLDFSKKKK